MLHTETSVGLSGEYRVVVKRADGSVRLDTGVHKNLFLDNGFKFLLALPHQNNQGSPVAGEVDYYGHHMFDNCLVGSGTTEPKLSDIKLESFQARQTGVTPGSAGVESPTSPEGKKNHPNHARSWATYKYTYENLEGVTVSELGLAMSYNSSARPPERDPNATYVLMTRTLVKDTEGRPISVTLDKGDLLEITYTLNLYIDGTRKNGEFTASFIGTDKQVTTETFTYFMQPIACVKSVYWVGNQIGSDIDRNAVDAWGVLERDDQLNADYDLNNETYRSISVSDDVNAARDKLGRVTSGQKWANNSNPADKYKENGNYATRELIEHSWETKRVTWRNTVGAMSLVFPNGIRAFRVPTPMAGSSYDGSYMSGLIVLKNKKNGQGLKKQRLQEWVFEHSLTFSRWGE